MTILQSPGTVGNTISSGQCVSIFYKSSSTTYSGLSGNFSWDTNVATTPYITMTPSNPVISLNFPGIYVCKFRCGFNFVFTTTNQYPMLTLNVMLNGSLYLTPYFQSIIEGSFTSPPTNTSLNVSSYAPVHITVVAAPATVEIEWLISGSNTSIISSMTSPTAASTSTTYGLSYSSITYYG